jgi:hypothetical protein
LKKTFAAIVALLACGSAGFTPVLRAQSGQSSAQSGADTMPQPGDHEMQVWAGGGPPVAGPQRQDSGFNVGFRYGWVMTGPYGPGFLRNRLEYTVEAVPVFLVFQPSGTAYGIGLNPVGLKWNFETQRRIKPYFDANFGVLFTDKRVPMRAGFFNFVTSPAFGVNIPYGKYHWSAEIRYQHISDAALTYPNPGDNFLEVRIGFGLFTHGK